MRDLRSLRRVDVGVAVRAVGDAGGHRHHGERIARPQHDQLAGLACDDRRCERVPLGSLLAVRAAARQSLDFCRHFECRELRDRISTLHAFEPDLERVH